MSQQIDLDSGNTQLASLVDRVESGEEIVISRGGRPVARLVPAQRDGATPRRLGGLEDRMWISDDFDAPDAEIDMLFHGGDPGTSPAM